MLTVDELRDLAQLLDETERERDKPYDPTDVVQIEQLLLPTRTATTARLPDEIAYKAIGNTTSRTI